MKLIDDMDGIVIACMGLLTLACLLQPWLL